MVPAKVQLPVLGYLCKLGAWEGAWLLAHHLGSLWIHPDIKKKGKKLLLIFFFFLSWLCWVFVASRGLSLAAVSRDYSLVAVCGLFIVLASLVVEHMQASVGVPPGLWSMGSVVVAHRLSCPLVSGIFQDQGLNLCSLHCKVDS